MPSYFVYILRCNDATFYTGWSTDINKRVARHNAGTGAKYTRSRCPVECVYTEECASKTEAMQREYGIKQLSHAEKLLLISKEAV